MWTEGWLGTHSPAAVTVVCPYSPLSVHFHFDSQGLGPGKASCSFVTGVCVLLVCVPQYLGQGLFWNRSALPQCWGRALSSRLAVVWLPGNVLPESAWVLGLGSVGFQVLKGRSLCLSLFLRDLCLVRVPFGISVHVIVRFSKGRTLNLLSDP